MAMVGMVTIFVEMGFLVVIGFTKIKQAAYQIFDKFPVSIMSLEKCCLIIVDVVVGCL